MNLLALDLGTTTGWASLVDDTTFSSSTSFAPRRREVAAHRWLKFRAFLGERAHGARLEAIYYEDVKRHAGTIAAHVYGGLVAHLELWAHVNDVRLVAIGVGTIKKHWTGKGSAPKSAMIAAAKQRGFRVVDDNEADALALLDYARNAEGDRTPTPIEQLATAVEHATGKLVEVWDDPFARRA